MTTYTFDALIIAGTYDWIEDSETLVYSESVAIDLVTSNSTSTFSYTIDALVDEGGGNSSYDVTVESFGDLYFLDNVYDEISGSGAGVNIQGIYEILGGDTLGSVSTISWSDGINDYETTILDLQYFYDVPSEFYDLWVDVVIVLAGDPLPDITSLEDFALLDGSITGQDASAPTGFQEGDVISVEGIGGTISENDDFVGNENYDDDVVLGLGNDKFSGLSGDDKVRGGNGSDKLNGDDGKDKLFGNNGNDTLAGGNDNDKLYGDDGKDLLRGQAGVDWLWGGADNDELIGGSGRDRLVGGTGDDTLTGGIGADRFIFDLSADEGTDTITDFSYGQDKIYALDGSSIIAGYEVNDDGTDTTVTFDNGTIVILENLTGIADDALLFA